MDRMIIRPIFRWHFLSAAVLGFILVATHLHLSGYGLTAYVGQIPITGIFQFLFGWLPAVNAYNVPSNCGLPLCGYGLTNVLHGFGGFWLGWTIALAGVTFTMGWYLFSSFGSVVGIVLAWEKWELATHVTQCAATNFGSIAQVCDEMLRLINDTVNDIVGGVIGLTLALLLLYVVDKRSGYEHEVDVH